MITSKTRAIIVTVVAALGVASVGPMTSIASARRPMKVGHIEAECSLKAGSATLWFPEGAVIHVTDSEGHSHYFICSGGAWLSCQEAAPALPAPAPSTNGSETVVSGGRSASDPNA